MRVVMVGLMMFAPTAFAQSREEWLRPSLTVLTNRWNQLPQPYRETHRECLAKYLALFTASNGSTWNREWVTFAAEMGREIAEIRVAVIEAMKVAEAHEALFPDPNARLRTMADYLWDKIPSNGVTFVQSDLLESALIVDQQINRKRPDVVVSSFTMLLDLQYLDILHDRYSRFENISMGNLHSNVMKEALERKQGGDERYARLLETGGNAHTTDKATLLLLSLDTMRAIRGNLHNAPIAMIPSMRDEAYKGVWRGYSNAGPVLTETGTLDTSELEWKQFIESAIGQTNIIHAQLLRDVDQSLAAGIELLKAKGHNVAAGNLLRFREREYTPLKTVESRSIRIHNDGVMVQSSD